MITAIALTVALSVVDGDTVKIAATGERLRLEHIDAPERGHRADCPSEAALAERATERLEQLLPHVAAIEDSGRRGGYGRRLVTLRLTDGRTAGDVLIAEHLAVPWAGRRHDWCQ